MDVKQRNDYTGIVLAGGCSSRFPFHKAFAKRDRQFFYEYAISVLELFTKDVLLLVHPSIKERITFSGVKLEDEEPYKGHGPLAGIYTGMKHSNSSWYAVLSCDMPCVMADLFQKLHFVKEKKSNVQAVIPVTDGHIHPLCAIYHRSCFPIIEQLLKKGKRRVRDLLAIINVEYVNAGDLGLIATQFQNVNTIEDYRTVLGRNVSD
ncbi:molybdenum cofactor guanylyltransferase [Fictibacillus sp. Mic-4]|uniref:molybdenum cofactor guanylyltransferase n=1 Tax=Fictibacillus TaxID=1329200 RepID=UPI00041FF536|nr:molybdenum cofactor guanylyltransferase [Fictibacillus gelatini]